MDNGHQCKLTSSYGGFVKSPDLTSTRCQILLKYWFSISLDNPRTKYHFRSIRRYDDERRRHLSSEYCYINHPFSKFSYYWGIIMMVAFLVVVPCDYIQNVYIISDTNTPVMLDTLIIILDFLNTIHIVVSFFTGYQKGENLLDGYSYELFKPGMNEIELNPGKIARKYIFSYFFIDMIGIVSLIKYFSAGANKKFHKYFYVYSEIMIIYLQIFRILRIITAISTLKLIMWNQKISDSVFKILKYFIWSIMFVVFCACHLIYMPYVLHNFDVPDDTLKYQVEKLYENAKFSKPSIEIVLLHSVKEVIEGVITPNISFLKINMEDNIMFSMVLIMGTIGKFFFFIVIYRTISDIFSPSFTYQKVKNELKDYLIFHDIDSKINYDTEIYLQQIMRNKYFNEQNILNIFPYKLQYEIFLDSSMDLIKTCKLFVGLPEQIIIDLCLSLYCEYLIPGGEIIYAGDTASCMYFIASGTVAVYLENTELCHLSDGQYFGEIGLLNADNLRTANVIAIEYCKIYRLRKEDFDNIVRNCQYIYERISKQITYRSTSWGTSIVV